MAHYRLALAASWAGEYTEILPAVRRAMQLSDRLPPSAQRFVQAFSAYRNGHYAEAEAIDRAILAERPAAIDVQFDLAELLYHGNPPRGRSITEARPAFEELLREDPHSFPAMSHLARLAAARNDTKALDSLTRNALAGNPDGPHRAELLVMRAVSLKDDSARRVFAAMPPDLSVTDALWRAAEYTGELAAIQEITEQLLLRSAQEEMRASLFAFLAHVAMGRERLADAERYADSLSAHAPQHGAVNMALLAGHPATVSARGRLSARAQAQVTPMLAPGARQGTQINLGSRRPDNGRPYLAVQNAMLALSGGDSSLARALVKDSAAHAVDPSSRVYLMLQLASTAAQRDTVLRAVTALDSAYGNQYAQQMLLSPRALLQLAISKLHAEMGQPEAALRRLETVPEDFGFNVGYLAEVHRRKAALLRSLGRGADAALEDAYVKRVVR